MSTILESRGPRIENKAITATTFMSFRGPQALEELIDTMKSIDYPPLFVGEFIKGWRYGLLIFELFLFALIFVLPQVDLPDFTFPGARPIVARSRLSPPSVCPVVLDPGHPRSLEHIGEPRSRMIQPAVHLDPFSPLTLTCTLRC